MSSDWESGSNGMALFWNIAEIKEGKGKKPDFLQSKSGGAE